MSAPRPTPGSPQNRIGKYRFLAELGHGGMADVYLAVAHGPAGFNKLVVIKQIRPHLSDDPQFLDMFLDEARLAARLSHPNVVQTNEVGHDSGRYFIAMEYLDGQPLNRILYRFKAAGGLPLAMHVRVLIDVLAGLEHAHELADYDGTLLGVVHRDVSPQNVVVTYDGTVKLVDFGIAKARSSMVVTKEGIVKGKVAYMAPEQLEGRNVDRRADVFAVGAMLWEAATGIRLWDGMSELAIAKRLLAGQIPGPRDTKPDVSAALDAIIRKAMSPKASDRYPTAAAFQAALEGFLISLGDHGHARDLGREVSTQFAAEHASIKEIIEQQLCAPPESVHVAMLPSASGGLAQETSRYASSGATLASSLPMRQPPPRGRWSFVTPIAIGAIVLGAVLGAFFVGRSATAFTPSQTASASASAEPPIELQLTAMPPETKIFLDDQPLDANPYLGKRARDHAPHQLRFEAPGFRTRREAISFENNNLLDITLDAEPEIAPGAAPASPIPSAAPSSWGTHSTKSRKLDAVNPYAAPVDPYP